MNKVADGVWIIRELPRHGINGYLVEHSDGDVLIDCGTRWARGRYLKALAGRRLSLVALTHCHPDHQGAAAAVCEKFGVSLACHEADVPTMEGRRPMQPDSFFMRISNRIWSGPPRRVDRVLRGDEEIAGFRVVPTPGHTSGHVVYFRESDGVVISGDVVTTMNLLTTARGVREPPGFFCVDAAENRRSIRKLHALRPRVLLPGHGPPCDDMEELDVLVAKLA